MKVRKKLSFLTLSALCTSVLCILSPISIPLGSIPITLSLFAVLLISAVFPVKIALCGVTAYVLIGAVGMPVFSGYTGGAQVFAGFTGGFIWAYPIIALIVSPTAAKGSPPKTAFSMLFGIIICYLSGAFQLGRLMGTPFVQSLAAVLVACIIPDVLKLFLALLLWLEISRRIKIKEFLNE